MKCDKCNSELPTYAYMCNITTCATCSSKTSKEDVKGEEHMDALKKIFGF